MKRLISALISPFKQVYPHERITFLLSALFSFGAVALAICIRTWSDTLFLTHFPVDRLPVFFIWSAFAFAPVTMGYTWLSRRISPIRLNTATLLLFAGCCLLCVHPSENPITLFITLLLMSLVSPLVNAICWGVVLERLSSLQSKRLIPLISSAATIGAVSAGLFAAEVIEWGGMVALMGTITLMLLALSCLPSALLVNQTSIDHRSGDQGVSDPPQKSLAQPTLELTPDRVTRLRWVSQFDPLWRHRLLLVIAIATLMMAVTTNLVDYLFKAEIQRQFSPHEIGPFLARFHAITNAFILGVQLFILSRLTERIGLKWSFPLYPISLTLVSLLCLSPLGWLSFVALRGVDSLMKFTIHSNTENLVLTPVPLVLRTQVKVLLKGAIYPLGGLIAGLLIWTIGAISSAYTLDPMLCAITVTITLCVVWMFTTSRVHLFYWEQLASNLGLPTGTLQRAPQRAALNQLRSLMTESVQRDLQSNSAAGKTNDLIDDIQVLQLVVSSFDLANYRPEVERAWYGDDKGRADLIAWVSLGASWQGLRDLGQQLETYASSRSKSSRDRDQNEHHEHNETARPSE